VIHEGLRVAAKILVVCHLQIRGAKMQNQENRHKALQQGLSLDKRKKSTRKFTQAGLRIILEPSHICTARMAAVTFNATS
jgi:hypothetical protein